LLTQTVVESFKQLPKLGAKGVDCKLEIGTGRCGWTKTSNWKEFIGPYTEVQTSSNSVDLDPIKNNEYKQDVLARALVLCFDVVSKCDQQDKHYKKHEKSAALSCL